MHLPTAEQYLHHFDQSHSRAGWQAIFGLSEFLFAFLSSVRPSVCLFNWLSVSPFWLCLFVCLSAYLSLCACFFLCLLICLSVCLLFCLSVCLSVYTTLSLFSNWTVSIFLRCLIHVNSWCFVYLHVFCYISGSFFQSSLSDSLLALLESC